MAEKVAMATAENQTFETREGGYARRGESPVRHHRWSCDDGHPFHQQS